MMLSIPVLITVYRYSTDSKRDLSVIRKSLNRDASQAYCAVAI